MAAPPLLEIQGLTVEFPSRSETGASADVKTNLRSLTAVRDLSLKISPGEVLGLVGESGSGKSVTSLAIMRLLPPTAKVSGKILFSASNGTDAPNGDLLSMADKEMRSIRGSRMAMIFQEPMTALNPVMKIGDQIAEAVNAHERGGSGLNKRQTWDRVIAALNDVAIADPERRALNYPHQLSGGIRQRVMIAMAIVNRPRLLVADEPTTALDVTIQAQIIELLMELRAKFGLAMLFISHDLAVVSQVADRVAVMYAGSLVELGSKQNIFKAANHPYTRGLLHAVPTLSTDRTRPLKTIEGTVPPLHAVPPGCPFEPRCESRVGQCAQEVPPLLEIAPGHWVRCPVVEPTLPGASTMAR